MKFDIFKLTKNQESNILIIYSILFLVVLGVIQFYIGSNSLKEKVYSEMEIVSESLAAPIVFDNPKDALDILNHLGKDPQIKSVCLRRNNGKKFSAINFDREKLWDPCEADKKNLAYKYLTTPIWFNGNLYGKLTIKYSTRETWLQSLQFITFGIFLILLFLTLIRINQNSFHIKMSKYEASLQQLLNKNNVLIEENNKHVALEIHDQIGQLISTSLIQLNHLDTKSNDSIVKPIKQIKENLAEIYKRIKNISKELHPVILKFGLGVGLESLAEQKFAHTNHTYKIYDETNDKIIAEKISINLYRIAQEAFTNILKHANASLVQIYLQEVNQSITLKIMDDGIGFNKDILRQTQSLGFISIAERVKNLNGTVHINSDSNGTSLLINIPNVES